MTTRVVPAITRVIGYIRVSTEEQVESGAGLVAQRLAIETEAARRGWYVVDIVADRGASGKSLAGRPALDAALGHIEDGLANTLVVAKLDRLSRSLLDFASLMSRARAEGWNLVALDLGIDMSTPAGEFLASVMASAAQWERRIIGQRTRDALAVKRSQGVRLGRPSVLGPDVVRRITDERSRGLSYAAIAHLLTSDGVPTARGGLLWHASTVRAVVGSRAGQAAQP
jgi:DNA invertase Pin-like site-specific DNA recombinase